VVLSTIEQLVLTYFATTQESLLCFPYIDLYVADCHNITIDRHRHI